MTKSIEIDERKVCDDGLTFIEAVSMTNADYNRHVIRRQRMQLKQEQTQNGGAGRYE